MKFYETECPICGKVVSVSNGRIGYHHHQRTYTCKGVGKHPLFDVREYEREEVGRDYYYNGSKASFRDK